MILYTEAEKRAFVALHPSTPTFVAANAVYPAAELTPATGTCERDSFILIGRLVEGKKPALVVRAFEDFRSTHPDARLLVIGTGPLLAPLREEFNSLVVAGAVEFLGQVDDSCALREHFARAVAMIGGGYVGLNVTQSLGFGVPVIFAGDEPHAPEVELLDEGNSRSFLADDSRDLARVMADVWAARATVDARAEKISAAVRAKYSTEVMADAFRAVVDYY